MVDFGVNPEGFNPKTLQDVLTSLRAKQRATIDPNWDAGDETLEGQLNGSFAEEAAELWEELDGLWNQFNPDDAENEAQDMLCSLTGTKRNRATQGKVTGVVLQSSGATTWPAGTLIAQSGDLTNVWSLDTAVVAGGVGTFHGDFTCVKAGHFEAPAGTLTEKISSVSAWVSVLNPDDASPGSDIESNDDLRIRREEELRADGGASEPAISASVEQIDPSAILSVKTLTNESDVTNGDGLPPHSFEVILWDPAPNGPVDDDLIAQTIWNNKAFGIATHGPSSGTAVTRAGEPKTINFTRPTERVLSIAVDVTITADFPLDGDQQVKNALLAYWEKVRKPGATIYPLQFRSAATKIQGVADSPACTIALNFGIPVPTNLTTTVREIATLDTSNITVNHV